MKFLYIDEGPYLPSLEHLVQHYTLFSDGLPVNLRVSVPPTPKPPLPLFSTMPKDVRHKSLGSFDSETSPLSPPPPIPVQPPLVLPPKSRQQLSPNPKPKPDTPIKFLTLTSKKKNIVIDGMRSLQKARKSKNDTTLSLPTSPPPLSLADVSMSLQNLSFSAELYNVPTNNAAVEPSAAGTTMRGDYLFTESDRLASDELVKEEDVYFVDAPVSADAPMPSNYVPTKIVARFTAEVCEHTKQNVFIEFLIKLDCTFSSLKMQRISINRRHHHRVSTDYRRQYRSPARPAIGFFDNCPLTAPQISARRTNRPQSKAMCPTISYQPKAFSWRAFWAKASLEAFSGVRSNGHHLMERHWNRLRWPLRRYTTNTAKRTGLRFCARPAS